MRRAVDDLRVAHASRREIFGPAMAFDDRYLLQDDDNHNDHHQQLRRPGGRDRRAARSLARL